jgi:hypothetical protein
MVSKIKSIERKTIEASHPFSKNDAEEIAEKDVVLEVSSSLKLLYGYVLYG